MWRSTCFAMVAVAAGMVSSGVEATGVCYSPWHHPSVDKDCVLKDLRQMKQYFNSFRTYHAQFNSVNIVDAAAEAGLKISVGVMMQDRSKIQSEIKAACEGARRHPDIVESIMVGNENMGQYSSGELIDFMNQMKGCVAGTGVKVGTVQTIGDWLTKGDQLAGQADVIGVNIYPFFTPGDNAPIDKLKAQWGVVNAKYPGGKCRITETGWPRAGDKSDQGQWPSKDVTQKFFGDFAQWTKELHGSHYFFMMYDLAQPHGRNYEQFFGLADTQGNLQVNIPMANYAGGETNQGQQQTPATEAPKQTEAPKTDAPAAQQQQQQQQTEAPKTEAPTTQAPAAATEAPAQQQQQQQQQPAAQDQAKVSPAGQDDETPAPAQDGAAEDGNAEEAAEATASDDDDASGSGDATPLASDGNTDAYKTVDPAENWSDKPAQDTPTMKPVPVVDNKKMCH